MRSNLKASVPYKVYNSYSMNATLSVHIRHI